MIKLINNELNKIKKVKVLFIYTLFTIVILLMNKYSNKDLFDLSFELIQFIGVVISILFSGTICGEIENGNMRYYLTKPYKRIKIYLSKLLLMILFTIINISIIVFTVMIIKNSYKISYVLSYFKYSIPLLFICIFVLFLSTKIKSSVLVASISIITLSFSLIVTQLLLNYNFNIIEYTFLPYLDFSIFKDSKLIEEMNKSYNIHLSINRGIVLNIIYFIILLIIGCFKFNKKDIKN